MLTEYIPYVISQRIKAFRRGLYPTTKQIIAKEIPEQWITFFKISKITNIDFREVMNEYKENKAAFLYVDPHIWIHIMLVIIAIIHKHITMIYQ